MLRQEKPKTSSTVISPMIFLFSIFVLAIQYLQLRMLTSQQDEATSSLNESMVFLIKVGYVCKITWGVISCVTAAFSSQDPTFLILKQVSLYSLIALFLFTIYQLYLTTSWLALYQGIDYIYVWYLAFIYLIEMIVMGPLSMFLIAAD